MAYRIKPVTKKIKIIFIFLFILTFGLTFYQLYGSAAGYKTITIKAFDKKGHKLTYKKFMDIVTNGNGRRAENDMLFNINDYTIVEGWPLYKGKNNNPCFDFKGSGIGLSLTWMTESTGYFNLFLDNEGEGFSKSEKIIFNHEAALSYWNHVVGRQFLWPSPKYPEPASTAGRQGLISRAENSPHLSPNQPNPTTCVRCKYP